MGRNSHTRPLFALPHSRSSLGRSSTPASIDRSSLHRRRRSADHDQATTLTSFALQASLASPNTGASPSPISHRHIDLFLDFLIQLQHKFWQPNVPQDSITAQFNYNSIRLQQNSITFLSITTNQTGPKSCASRNFNNFYTFK
ncbi:hypothetical protein LXL04_014453 [Taraxacum kok-saghyz]